MLSFLATGRGMKRGVKERQGHHWITPKRLGWLTFCWRCGLVALRNSLTQKAIKAGCFDAETEMDMP